MSRLYKREGDSFLTIIDVRNNCYIFKCTEMLPASSLYNNIKKYYNKMGIVKIQAHNNVWTTFKKFGSQFTYHPSEADMVKFIKSYGVSVDENRQYASLIKLYIFEEDSWEDEDGLLYEVSIDQDILEQHFSYDDKWHKELISHVYALNSKTIKSSPFMDSSMCPTVTNVADNKNKKEEKEDMKLDLKKQMNVDFGKIEDGSVAFSMLGTALKAGDKYISYKDGEVIDVTGVTMDFPAFKMPIPISQIKQNDLIIHSNEYVYVKSVGSDGLLSVFNVADSSYKKVAPIKSVLGFNFYTKVFTFDVAGSAASTNEFNPMMLMLMGDNSDFDLKSLLMMQMMNGGGSNLFNGAGAQFNPMMLMLMGDNKGNDNSLKDLMMMQMMGGMNLFNPPKGE